MSDSAVDSVVHTTVQTSDVYEQFSGENLIVTLRAVVGWAEEHPEQEVVRIEMSEDGPFGGGWDLDHISVNVWTDEKE